jgi:23S rRNA (guanosine2251-2'-O)-methyltransferase
MAGKPKRPPRVGSGGRGRKALEGKGPTPKAEDRQYHKAYRAKQERAKTQPGKPVRSGSSRDTLAARRGGTTGSPVRTKTTEVLFGRNSVLEALRARIPARALMLAQRIETDDRVREILTLANKRGIPISEVTRSEIDRLAGADSVHQGLLLTVPTYQYQSLDEILAKADSAPILVALDGITDARNLGAIIRSVAAFGGAGVVLPQRRTVGVTAATWKTSAGALARTPVAQVPNLNQLIANLKRQNFFVLGLSGDAELQLSEVEFLDRPLLIVVGSEDKGLSRLVSQNCDQMASIPIQGIESLNASVAMGIALYQVSQSRG